MVLGLDLMNYFLPNVKRPWHWMTPGTVFVALTMVAGSGGLQFLSGSFRKLSAILRHHGGIRHSDDLDLPGQPDSLDWGGNRQHLREFAETRGGCMTRLDV